jgi:endonuclease YncB( thermonuclease family)
MQRALVQHVTDGDTIVVTYWQRVALRHFYGGHRRRRRRRYPVQSFHWRFVQERIRLATIDAPELNDVGGEQARAKLRELLYKIATPRRVVYFRRVGSDYFGRTIAHVYVDEHGAAFPVNASNWMVREGYAWPLREYGATAALIALFWLRVHAPLAERRGLWRTLDAKKLVARRKEQRLHRRKQRQQRKREREREQRRNVALPQSRRRTQAKGERERGKRRSVGLPRHTPTRGGSRRLRRRRRQQRQ